MDKTDKDTQLDTGSLKALKDNDLFSGDLHLMYAVKKTERLAAAMYIITERLPENDSLRTRLRELSLLSLRKLCAGLVNRRFLSAPLTAELVALLSAGISARLLPEEHARVLEEEYRKIAALIVERGEKSAAGSADFAPSFLDVPPPVAVSHEGKWREPYRSPWSATPRSPRREGAMVETPSHPAASARREQILSAVKARGSLTISDLMGVVKGCSGKTIQRELTALIALGALTREGRRRWSTYRLADAPKN